MSFEIVDTSEALERLTARVRASERVALDTEFHSERSYSPRLMVVQLAFDDGDAIVDPLALTDLRALADALGETLVVGHALGSDLRIFAERFGIVPPRLFDTQIAASFLGYGMQISLSDLVHDLRGVRLAKSQTVSDWSVRPFSPRQIEYLVDDVVHLLPMQARLAERLSEAGRAAWAAEECAQLGTIERYHNDERRAYLKIPGATRMNRRELAILREVVKLRDALARERDLPLRFVMPDDVVAGLATLKPARVEELAQLRRLDAGARKHLGAKILEAVARGEALPENELPEKSKRPLGLARDTLVAVMGVLVGEIAIANELPQSLLVSRATLERIAREVPRDRASLEAALDLSPWRLALVAEPLWGLLSGGSRLGVEGYATGNPKITLVP